MIIEYIHFFLRGIAALVIAGAFLTFVFVGFFVALAIFTKWDEKK